MLVPATLFSSTFDHCAESSTSSQKFPKLFVSAWFPQAETKSWEIFCQSFAAGENKAPATEQEQVSRGAKSQTQEHRHADSLAKLCGNDRPRPTGDGICFASTAKKSFVLALRCAVLAFAKSFFAFPPVPQFQCCFVL